MKFDQFQFKKHNDEPFRLLRKNFHKFWQKHKRTIRNNFSSFLLQEGESTSWPRFRQIAVYSFFYKLPVFVMSRGQKCAILCAHYTQIFGPLERVENLLWLEAKVINLIAQHLSPIRQRRENIVIVFSTKFVESHFRAPLRDNGMGTPIRNA